MRARTTLCASSRPPDADASFTLPLVVDGALGGDVELGAVVVVGVELGAVVVVGVELGAVVVVRVVVVACSATCSAGSAGDVVVSQPASTSAKELAIKANFIVLSPSMLRGGTTNPSFAQVVIETIRLCAQLLLQIPPPHPSGFRLSLRP